MIKPFLHERTKSKISIFGHDSKQWKLAILEDVDPEELPASYGGTLTDPDGNENCITMASHATLSLSDNHYMENLIVITG